VERRGYAVTRIAIYRFGDEIQRGDDEKARELEEKDEK